MSNCVDWWDRKREKRFLSARHIFIFSFELNVAWKQLSRDRLELFKILAPFQFQSRPAGHKGANGWFLKCLDDEESERNEIKEMLQLEGNPITSQLISTVEPGPIQAQLLWICYGRKTFRLTIIRKRGKIKQRCPKKEANQKRFRSVSVYFLVF